MSVRPAPRPGLCALRHAGLCLADRAIRRRLWDGLPCGRTLTTTSNLALSKIMVQTLVNRPGIGRVSCEDDNIDGVTPSAGHRRPTQQTPRSTNWTPDPLRRSRRRRARYASRQLEGREGNVATRRNQYRRRFDGHLPRDLGRSAGSLPADRGTDPRQSPVLRHRVRFLWPALAVSRRVRGGNRAGTVEEPPISIGRDRGRNNSRCGNTYLRYPGRGRPRCDHRHAIITAPPVSGVVRLPRSLDRSIWTLGSVSGRHTVEKS